ncbi:MAG TPA: carboxylating nicotinate-nucleotide diphosphorylase [Chitinophagaceae bacterium]|nr:carboxylating nicotinate-nucleotide diphosphorylase [Chitinophagaceae bacterium]
MLHFDERLHVLVQAALDEDLGEGDHSSLAVIPADARGKALLKIKQDGILAGVEIAKKIFHSREPAAVFLQHKHDGEAMQAGETAFTIEASVHTILACERLVLNCMQRMSGIATLTHQYVQEVRGYSSKILDTRKTTPGFRLLEKEAVRIGGGVNHRFGLFDMIMLKDNHIDYGGGLRITLDKAHAYAQQYKPALKIEVEARTLEDVREVIASGKADRIMLDNFSPSQLGEALILIQKKMETEASGGISLDNIRAYAATGVDYISIGALIHQAKSLDLSLKAM